MRLILPLINLAAVISAQKKTSNSAAVQITNQFCQDNSICPTDNKACLKACGKAFAKNCKFCFKKKGENDYSPCLAKCQNSNQNMKKEMTKIQAKFPQENSTPDDVPDDSDKEKGDEKVDVKPTTSSSDLSKSKVCKTWCKKTGILKLDKACAANCARNHLSNENCKNNKKCLTKVLPPAKELDTAGKINYMITNDCESKTCAVGIIFTNGKEVDEMNQESCMVKCVDKIETTCSKFLTNATSLSKYNSMIKKCEKNNKDLLTLAPEKDTDAKVEPNICGPNEFFNQCATNPKCQAEACKNNFPKIKVIKCDKQCYPRCSCEKGYARNENDDCIPVKECPNDGDDFNICGPNERYDNCNANCQKTCDMHLEGIEFDCTKECYEGCVCEKGFIRDGDYCIPLDKCEHRRKTECNNQNEIANTNCWEILNCDEWACDNLDDEEVKNCYKKGMYVKVAACYQHRCECAPGYIRASSELGAECIPEKKCKVKPPKECPVNQHYQECGTACEDNCDDLEKSKGMCIEMCVSGCFCDPGYVKESEDLDLCVPVENCPVQKCGENEYFDRCGPFSCGETCENIGLPEYMRPMCMPPPEGFCLAGCFCEPCFIRSEDGTCKNIKECSMNPKCPDGLIFNKLTGECEPEITIECPGKNEYFDTCGKPSICETCENIGLPKFMKPECDFMLAVCEEGCFCEKGFVRDKQGVCRPIKFCLKNTHCPDGYEFDSRAKKCIAAVQCPWNSHYEICGSQCPNTCDNLEAEAGTCIESCFEGCVCDPGYVKEFEGENARCVPIENCPMEKCELEFEYFDRCHPGLCGVTCENIGLPDYMKPLCGFPPGLCFFGCYCQDGYIRSEKDGSCRPVDECKKEPRAKY